MKRIAVLGSTGSIGRQTLDLIAGHRDRFTLTALSCGKNIRLLREQALRFRPGLLACAEEEDASWLRESLAEDLPETRVLWGEAGLRTLASSDTDMVLNSLVGILGLAPTLWAIEAGHDLALANKESLVAGGALVMKKIREKGVSLLPVDSEHSAIFQCLAGNQKSKIRRILLTASGGPFRGKKLSQLAAVTPEEALRHPTWRMGQRISIDSATMMNKGFERLEAKWLFDLPLADIEVVVHPESIIHSAVEFEDTAILAQLGLPDMKIPIGVALAHPDRLTFPQTGLSLFSLSRGLHFEKPDEEAFPCLTLAAEADARGGLVATAMNAADEEAVAAFLQRKIGFCDIARTIRSVIQSPLWETKDGENLSTILEVDREARLQARRVMASL